MPRRPTIVLSALTDDELVASIGKHRPTAMAEVYERHSVEVRTLAATLWGSACADRVVHDVFAVLWDRPESFDRAQGSLRVHLSMQVRLWRPPAAGDATPTSP